MPKGKGGRSGNATNRQNGKSGGGTTSHKVGTTGLPPAREVGSKTLPRQGDRGLVGGVGPCRTAKY